MDLSRFVGIVAAAASLAWLTPAGADYERFPELRPGSRCVTEKLDEDGQPVPGPDGKPVMIPFAEAGVDPLHCQKLTWDLPASTRRGFVAAGAPFHDDAVPRFPNGITDRPPPRWVFDPEGTGAKDCDPDFHAVYEANPECGDGVADGFEEIPTGLTAAELGRRELCPDPDQIPWWKPIEEITEDDARIPVEGYGDPLPGVGSFAEGGDMGQQKGPLFEVSCRRGTRTYFGPWQVGTDPRRFDAIGRALVRFESSARMDRDYENWPSGAELPPQRLEWNTGSEIYNHFASHHMTIWNAGNQTCNNPDDPESAADMSKCGAGYQYAANPPEEKDPDPQGNDGARPGACWYGNVRDGSCPNSEFNQSGNAFRNGTQLPGRIHVQLPDGRAAPSLEDQIWPAEHHVVHQLPSGSYDIPAAADYRKQKGGLVNTSGETRFDTEPGEVFGGSVAEVVFNYFTEPLYQGNLKPLSVMFEVVQDLATTWYPPFTYVVKELYWYPPFDAAIGLISTHSHHRSVKIHVDVVPANPLRSASADPACGGSAGDAVPEHIFESWEWEDAKICQYWKEPDKALIVRKGQGLRTTCYVNNGVTPEAIKHGLVAGSTLEAFGAGLGSLLPETPLGPAMSDDPKNDPHWGDLLYQSPVGQQYLYGTHPPENYRVKYSCGDAPGLSLDIPLNDGASVCNPNPAVDADGDYVDGPYRNEEQCGDGWCNPSTIVFRPKSCPRWGCPRWAAT
ncbi:MAG: hypothetical protein ACREQY_10565 [Candidatus Binatia bacterium]